MLAKEARGYWSHLGRPMVLRPVPEDLHGKDTTMAALIPTPAIATCE